MDCHCVKNTESEKKGGAYPAVALVGNPNVGKSVMFGLLTGKYATVSNYPGTTVEVTSGNIQLDGRKFLLVDTPGVNSLLPMSEDEQVTRDILLKSPHEKILQMGDTKNLKRTLAITVQLAEMGLPMVLALNMEDEARDRGITVDVRQLSEMLGIEVVSTVAPERRGLRELRSAIAAEGACVPNLQVKYPQLIEEYIGKVARLLPEVNISRRSLAVMLLCGDETLREWLTGNLESDVVDQIETFRIELRTKYQGSVGQAINESRMRRAGELALQVTRRIEATGGRFLQFLGQASMHPVWGIPVLLAVLFAMYEFVGVLGADIMVGFIEETLFGEYLNPMFTKVVETLLPIQFFQDLLVGEYGVITMALTYAIGIVLPITTTFFIAFSILEDSGYLPRLAIMSNKIFNIMGLSGKAVLPMVLGLGCGTMAVMTTRILETRRDRIIATFLLALAVPCAAQLGVIMGIIGGLSAKALAVWIGVLVGVLMFTGWLAAKIVRGEKSDFFLEIPPIRVPSLMNVLVKTVNRAVWYLKEAVPLFIYGTLALFLLDQLNLIGTIRDFFSPVIIGVLELPEEATEAFLIGFFRRDYGAAGLYNLNQEGMLTPVQTMVSLVTITLFVPCLAHFFMMIKERGIKLAVGMLLIIIPIAITVGGVMNWVLKTLNVSLV